MTAPDVTILRRRIDTPDPMPRDWKFSTVDQIKRRWDERVEIRDPEVKAS